MRTFVAAVLAAGFVVPWSNALADEVVLESGGRLLGIVKEEGEEVVVETAYGIVRLPREMVLSIDRTKRSQVEEYYDRAEATDMRSAAEVYELAQWAKEKGLTRFARQLLQKVLALDPEHEMARRELGFVRFRGEWLTEEEVLLAKGFVKHGGRWVTESERELLIKKELEEKQKREEEKRRREEERRRRAEEVARRNAGRGVYRENVSEIWPILSGPSGTQYAPYYPMALTHDFRSYIENLYGQWGLVDRARWYYWPFYGPPPWR